MSTRNVASTYKVFQQQLILVGISLYPSLRNCLLHIILTNLAASFCSSRVPGAGGGEVKSIFTIAG